MSTKQTLPAPTATRRSRIVFLLLIASVAVLTTLLLVPLLDNGRQSGIAWHWSAHRHAWKWNTGDHRRGGGADDNDIPRLCAHMRERRDEEDVRASTTSTTSTPRPFGITLEPPAWHNPRTFQNARLLIRNATVWTGLGEVLHGADVLMAGGIIQHIGNDVLSQGMGDAESADAPPILPLRVIEAHGRVLTPGIVDMHSHSGMSMWPAYDGADDVNEVSGPVMPQLRAIDAFSPEDPSVYLSATGGVTT